MCLWAFNLNGQEVLQMTLSWKLRQLADVVEGSEIDDDRAAQLTFRIEEDTVDATDVPIMQVDDPFDGTVLATIDADMVSDNE